MCAEDIDDRSTLSRRLWSAPVHAAIRGHLRLLLTELRATLLGAVDIDDIVGKALAFDAHALANVRGTVAT